MPMTWKSALSTGWNDIHAYKSYRIEKGSVDVCCRTGLDYLLLGCAGVFIQLLGADGGLSKPLVGNQKNSSTISGFNQTQLGTRVFLS